MLEKILESRYVIPLYLLRCPRERNAGIAMYC